MELPGILVIDEDNVNGDGLTSEAIKVEQEHQEQEQQEQEDSNDLSPEVQQWRTLVQSTKSPDAKSDRARIRIDGDVALAPYARGTCPSPEFTRSFGFN
ncbi:hypothetical protein BGZ80_005502 [Entomortierella chlamydospora]|uniref:Uncharacterized protein n=1 Tax=Entomortierella chlamydospora TaxID=101097 RepID=A0A9P6MJR7_9FUNG|nr:hypothetical protein BGZ80_005502 [Entomortierella chlamydospora]